MPLGLRLRRSVSSDRGLVNANAGSLTSSISSTTFTAATSTVTTMMTATESSPGLRRGVSMSGISRALSSSASTSTLSASATSSTMTPVECFAAAVWQNNAAAVLKLLMRQTQRRSLLGTARHKKINVNCQLDYGMTALHQAAFNGNVPMMQVLLDHGAMVDMRDARGLRPLHVASYQGHCEAVHLLLKRGSQADLTACGGLSPLHLACQAGHYEIVKQLLCSNADPMLRTDDGRTAFDVACEFGRFAIAQLLLSLKSVSCLLYEDLEAAQPNQSQSCLHLAAKNGHVDVLRLLLTQPGVNPNRMTEHGTCLHLAAVHGQLEAVKFLLELGVDPTLENSFGQTAKDAISRETPNGKELQHLLSERILAVEAVAIRDFCDLADSSSIAFRQGERITVLERGGGWHPNPAMWKGYATKEGLSRSGYFPCSAVHVLPAPAAPSASCEARASAQASLAPSAAAAAAAAANGALHAGQLKGSVDSGLGPRQSVVSTCSSGSSAGSLPDDCASMLSSSSGLGGSGAVPEPVYRPDEWRRAGLSANEQLLRFLNLAQFGVYYRNFADAGYDLPAMTRCTPEDLNAVGLTNPKHRKRLRAELARLAKAAAAAGLPDPVEEAARAAPPTAPVGELCRRLGLPADVGDALAGHGFARARDLPQMAWEDLEDVGVTKLGHQKKLMLLADRLKRLQTAAGHGGSPDRRSAQQQQQLQQSQTEETVSTEVAIRTHPQRPECMSALSEAASHLHQHQPGSQWDQQLLLHQRAGKPVAKILGRPVAVAIPEVPSSASSVGLSANVAGPAKVPPPPPKRVTSIRRESSRERSGERDTSPPPPPPPPPPPQLQQQQPTKQLEQTNSGQPYENLSVIENVIREMSQQHSGSAGSGGSGGSGGRSDSAASIPFANENCGTIRQRPPHPGVTVAHSHSLSTPSRTPMSASGSPKIGAQRTGPPVPQRQQQQQQQQQQHHHLTGLTQAVASPVSSRRPQFHGLKAPRRDDSFSNLDDICDMLSDLQSILDKELRGQAAS